MDIIGLEDLPRGTRQRLNKYYQRYPTHIRYGHGKKEEEEEDDDLYWTEMEGRLENHKEERRKGEKAAADD